MYNSFKIILIAKIYLLIQCIGDWKQGLRYTCISQKWNSYLTDYHPRCINQDTVQSDQIINMVLVWPISSIHCSAPQMTQVNTKWFYIEKFSNFHLSRRYQQQIAQTFHLKWLLLFFISGLMLNFLIILFSMKKAHIRAHRMYQIGLVLIWVFRVTQ